VKEFQSLTRIVLVACFVESPGKEFQADDGVDDDDKDDEESNMEEGDHCPQN